jgi:hypothetical protein
MLGICQGLPIPPYTGNRECAAGPLYWPDDIDDNDNIRPVQLVSGLCVACIEARADEVDFINANYLDFA